MLAAVSQFCNQTLAYHLPMRFRCFKSNICSINLIYSPIAVKVFIQILNMNGYRDHHEIILCHSGGHLKKRLQARPTSQGLRTLHQGISIRGYERVYPVHELLGAGR